MNGVYSSIILIAIIALSGVVCTKNYKKRGATISNNLLEYCCYIIDQYNLLNEDEKLKLKESLSDKELKVFHKLIDNSREVGKNLYALQSQMLTLESIMKKLKSINN